MTELEPISQVRLAALELAQRMLPQEQRAEVICALAEKLENWVFRK